jgi:ParB family transcriptional regulator, chromosome partitioning protein
MSVKDRLAAKSALIGQKPLATKPTSTEPERAKTGPGQLMASRPFLAEKDKQIASLTALLADSEAKLAKANSGAFDVRLDQLVEVPGRRRKLTAKQKLELRENLRHNKLVHPIVVRPIGSDKYEIVSGHNRVDQYRELGRDRIRSVTDDVGDDEAAAGAFFANLMQSDLTDYEKYLGFKDLQSRYPDLTQAEMAQKAGVDPSAVSRLMAFADLPDEVLRILDSRPELLGSVAGHALSVATKDGNAERVVEEVKRLEAGEIDQGQAVKRASSKQAATMPKSTADVVKIRVGRSVYCEVRQGKNVLRLQFQSEEEARAVREAVEELLSSRATSERQKE